MIDPGTVQVASAAVYVAATAVLLAWLRRIDEDLRLYCYPVVAVVGLTALSTVAELAGVGAVVVAGERLHVVGFVRQVVGYALLWSVAVLLAGTSRRMLGLVTGISVTQSLAFQLVAFTTGLVALGLLAWVVVGHVVTGVLLLGPVWRDAQATSERRRLLHWKARNLLLFLIGVLIVYAVVASLAGLDPVVLALVTAYTGALINLGFAGFVFVNLTDVDRPDDFAVGTGVGRETPETPAGD